MSSLTTTHTWPVCPPASGSARSKVCSVLCQYKIYVSCVRHGMFTLFLEHLFPVFQFGYFYIYPYFIIRDFLLINAHISWSHEELAYWLYIKIFILFYSHLSVVFWDLMSFINIWGHITCSSGTLSIVLAHWNVMWQTQDITPHPVTVYRHRADLPLCYLLMWNVKLEYTISHFNVLGQTRPGNPSLTSHTHTSECSTLWCCYGTW